MAKYQKLTCLLAYMVILLFCVYEAQLSIFNLAAELEYMYVNRKEDTVIREGRN